MDIESTNEAPALLPVDASEGSPNAGAAHLAATLPQAPEQEAQPALIVHLPPASAVEPLMIGKGQEVTGQAMTLERKKRSTSGNKMNQLLNTKKSVQKPKQLAKSASKTPKPKQPQRTHSATSASGKENTTKPKVAKITKNLSNSAPIKDSTPGALVQAPLPGAKTVKKAPTSNKKNPKLVVVGSLAQPVNPIIPQVQTQPHPEPQMQSPNLALASKATQPKPAISPLAATSPKKLKTSKNLSKPTSAKKPPPMLGLIPQTKKSSTNTPAAKTDPSPDQRTPIPPASREQPAPQLAADPTHSESDTRAEREPRDVKASTTAAAAGKKKVTKDFGWRYYPVGTPEVNYLKDWLLQTKEKGVFVHRKSLGIDERLLTDVGVKVAGGLPAHPVRDIPKHLDGDPLKDAGLPDQLEAEAEGPAGLGKRLPSTSNGLAPGKTPKIGMMMTGGDGTRKILDVASSIEERLLKFGRLGEDDGIIKRKAHNLFIG